MAGISELLENFARRLESRIDDVARSAQDISLNLNRRLSACEQVMGASTFVENVFRSSSSSNGVDSDATHGLPTGGGRHVEFFGSFSDDGSADSGAALSSTRAAPRSSTNPFLDEDIVRPFETHIDRNPAARSIPRPSVSVPQSLPCTSRAYYSSNPFNPFTSSNYDPNPASDFPLIGNPLSTHRIASDPISGRNPDFTNPAGLAARPELGRKTKPPPYNGKASWYDYLRQFEIISDLNQWSEADRANMLAASLRDDALAVLSALPRCNQLSFHTLCRALEQRFGGVQGTHITTFRVRMQRQKESITEFAFDLQRLACLAFPDCPPEAVQKLIVSQFLEGLKETNTKIMVQLSRPNTLDEALRTALEVDASLASSRPGNARPFYLVEQNLPARRSNNRRRNYRRRPNRPTENVETQPSQSGNASLSAPEGTR